MDPLSLSLAIAPLLLASAKLTKQVNEFADRYNNAPITLTSICTECKLIHVALCKIQGLVYESNSVLTARLSSEKSLRDAFDSALTGCRMTVAAVDVEIRKVIESESVSHSGRAEIPFKRKLRYVWKENLMQSLLDQTRGQMASIQFLISLLQSETLSEILRLVQTNKEPLRKNFSKARSLRSSQGFEDALSTFDSDGRSIAHDVIPTYEEQLQRSTAYQRAQAASAQDLLAAKLELLEAKYTLEDKVDDLELDINLKESLLGDLRDQIAVEQEARASAAEELRAARLDLEAKYALEGKVDDLELEINRKESLLSDLRGQVAAKDAKIAHMVLERRQSHDASRKMQSKKDRLIVRLGNELADLNRPDIYVQILGRTWTLDSLRTPSYSSSAPGILFYWAANNGDAEAARFIYDTMSVDGRYVDRKTNLNALQVASKQNYPSVVQTLLSLGLTSGHDHAIQVAVDQGHLDIVRMLRDSGARIFQLPLSAVQNGYEEIVKILIGDNVDISDPSLLECAVINRHNGIVKALSSENRSLHKSGNTRKHNLDHKKTPLEAAAYGGDTSKLYQMRQTLPALPKDILLNALYYAICNLQSPSLRILLNCPVLGVEQGSYDTRTMFRKALDIAICIGNAEIIGIMKETEYDGKLSPDTDHTDSPLMDLNEPIQFGLAL